MAFGKSTELEIELAAKNKEIEMLREMLTAAEERANQAEVRLARTQDALVAKESPRAYEDFREAEAELAASLSPAQDEETRRRKIETSLQQKYLEEMERPLFVDADDMFETLMKANGAPRTESLHGDSES